MTQVQIPAGCGPGSVLQIQGPQGPVMFTVPAGAVDGQPIQIQAGETTMFVKLVGVPAPGTTLPPGAAKPLPEIRNPRYSGVWFPSSGVWLPTYYGLPACCCLFFLFIAAMMIIQNIIGSVDSDKLEAKCRASGNKAECLGQRGSDQSTYVRCFWDGCSCMLDECSYHKAPTNPDRYCSRYKQAGGYNCTYALGVCTSDSDSRRDPDTCNDIHL